MSLTGHSRVTAGSKCDNLNQLCRDRCVDIATRGARQMKRGFVYGIGGYFMVGAIWMPTKPANRYYLIHLDESAVAFELGLVVAAVIAYYAATFFPPRRS